MNSKEFDGLLAGLGSKIRRLPNDIAALAADEFDRNFETESFFGAKWTASKYVARENARVGKVRHLLHKTGNLRRSIGYKVSGSLIIFESNVPYAGIHNEGGTVQHPGGTAYFYSKKRGKAIFVNNRTAGRFKHKLPVTKPHPIEIPQRQFIGNDAKLEAMIEQEIRRAFRIRN
jgi:phage gpG-like protein